MRLDPDHELSAAAVEAIRRALPRPARPGVEDRELLRMALGIADGESRLRCAAALLDSPAVRGRLAEIRRRLGEALAEVREGRSELLVLRCADEASRIARTLAEGRWSEASSRLAGGLPDLRAGWSLADGLGMHGAVETLARSLLRPLMELGEREAFSDLLGAGYRASAALPSPDLRQWLLSYEGADASYRGDSAGARKAWNARLDEARERGDRVREAASILDLAEQAQSDGDHDEARAHLAAAEPVVARIGRPDYRATILASRALMSLREGDVAAAADLSRGALAALDGTDGADVGLFVRLTAARALAASQRRAEAVRALADVLERCVEAGRPVDAASCLATLSELLEREGLVGLARRALALAAGIGRALGSRRLASTEAQLAAFAGRHPGEGPEPPGDWVDGSAAIVDELRDFRESPALAR